MGDISGVGSVVTLIASNTYPTGIVLTQYASDNSPFDISEINIGNGEMGVNGEFVSWSLAALIPFKIWVIPNSLEDRALNILFQANMTGKGKLSAKDKITLSQTDPSSGFGSYSDGICASFIPGKPMGQDGRYASKPYGFMFGKFSGL